MKLLLLFGVILMFAQVGCSRKVNLKDLYNSNIKKLHVCYSVYLQQHDYRGPKTEEELIDFLTTDPTAIHLLKRIDLTPEMVPDIFVSERDSEPFVVRYGLNGQADHAVVFEATGIDGKRLVALSEPVELDKSEYEQYLTGEKKGVSMDGSADGGG